MKKNILNILFATFALLCLFSCDQDDHEDIDNQVFIERTQKTQEILLGSEDSDVQSFVVRMLKTRKHDVICKFAVNESKVSAYNLAYSSNASLLSTNYYTISTSQDTIASGNINTSPIQVSFKNLSLMNRDSIYVLPITLSSNEKVLESKATVYYVLKAGALINVVGILKENGLFVNWKDASDLSAMETFTAEVLLYPNAFNNGLSTVMGVEGKFLLRFGDSAPKDQLQIATSNGNYTSTKFVMPRGKWTHLALTYNATDRKIQVYYDGVLKDELSTSNIGKVNWGTYYSPETDSGRSFWIGYSYAADRYFDGYMSECRIWNRVLTADEINAENHFYTVDPASEGLIAYWKLNDGAGKTIKDYSAKGNDGTAMNTMSWYKVSLGL